MAEIAPEVDIVVLDLPTDGQRNAELDGWFGAAVAQGLRRPTIRLWRSAIRAGLSVSRKDVATMAGAAAKQSLQEGGLDVIVRETGGTAVPQGAGVFHVSWILPRSRTARTTDAYFRVLCKPLLAWLAHLGVEGTIGALTGSYCDGKYNILVGGRKLAGTAQAWKGGLAGVRSHHPGYVVAHACLTVEVDFPAAEGWINRFYTNSGEAYRVLPDTSVALRTMAPQHFSDLDARAACDVALASLQTFLRAWLPERGVAVRG